MTWSTSSSTRLGQTAWLRRNECVIRHSRALLRMFMCVQALARDGFCCMVTGHIDYHSARANRRVQWPPGYEDKAFVLTECCYILPESTTQHADAAHPDHAPKVRPMAMRGCSRALISCFPRQRPGVASVLDVLQAFGLQDLATKLSDVNGIHHPSNVLTMHHYLHSMFRELLFWLEPTDIPNQVSVTTNPPSRAPDPLNSVLAVQSLLCPRDTRGQCPSARPRRRHLPRAPRRARTQPAAARRPSAGAPRGVRARRERLGGRGLHRAVGGGRRGDAASRGGRVGRAAAGRAHAPRGDWVWLDAVHAGWPHVSTLNEDKTIGIYRVFYMLYRGS